MGFRSLKPRNELPSWTFELFLLWFMKKLTWGWWILLMQGGILLGPSAIGRNEKFLNTIFPKRSLTVLETVANLGLLFFLFLVGL